MEKRVMITGCSRGLGYQLWKTFNSGAVIPHFRKNTEFLQHPKFMVEGDISDRDTINNIIEVMQSHYINVFINNAAVYSNTLIHDLSEKEINTVISNNFTAQVQLLTQVNKLFLYKNQGFIINISSLAVKYPSASESLYSATKAGVSAFLKSMQLENIGTNVHCMDIYVGAMRTDMTKHRKDHNSLINPAEVANQIYSIVNNDSGSMYVNELTIRKS
jgi:short-subunit dehydrogenase